MDNQLCQFFESVQQRFVEKSQHLTDKKVIINGESYAKRLNWCSDDLKTKKLPHLAKNWVLFHQNEDPHVRIIYGKIQWIGLEFVYRPKYFPDIAPSDCFLFPHLKKWLVGKRFSLDLWEGFTNWRQFAPSVWTSKKTEFIQVTDLLTLASLTCELFLNSLNALAKMERISYITFSKTRINIDKIYVPTYSLTPVSKKFGGSLKQPFQVIAPKISPHFRTHGRKISCILYESHQKRHIIKLQVSNVRDGFMSLPALKFSA